MKKSTTKILAFALLASTLIFTSCNIPPDGAAAATVASPPSFRGLYVDSLANMLSDTSKSNTMIRWAKKKGFNSLYFYNLNTVLATGGSQAANMVKLDSIITRARRAGITRIASVRGSQSTSIDTSNHASSAYYNTKCSSTGKFNTFNLENEYWNYGSSEGAVNFSTWSGYKAAMYTWARAKGYFSDSYIGHLKDPGGDPAASSGTMAASLVLNNHRILVHDYVDTIRFATKDGAFTYMKSRLDEIGKAALAKKTIAHVVIIFAGTTADGANYNMRYYFKKNGFQAAYDKVKLSFTNSTFAGKKGIILVGYQIYAYHRVKDL